MPQKDKQMEEILKTLSETNEKHKLLEEEIKKLNQKIDTLMDHLTSQQMENQQQKNAESLIKYWETHHGYLQNIQKIYIEEEAYKTRKYNLKMWRSLLNERKIKMFNAIKSKETAKIYKEFIERENIFIPRKFCEKSTPQDTEEQKKIKSKLNLAKLKIQIELQEDKTSHYTTNYLRIDQEILVKIKELCPKMTQQFLLELWESECKKEEEKSKTILEKKTTWLRNLPQKEQDYKNKNEEKQKQQQKNQETHPKNVYRSTHYITNPQNNNFTHQHYPQPKPYTHSHSQENTYKRKYNQNTYYYTQTHPYNRYRRENTHNIQIKPNAHQYIKTTLYKNPHNLPTHTHHHTYTQTQNNLF